MTIELYKFGTTLISRQAGKEALAAFESSLKNISEHEEMMVDFKGVLTFSPSWGDEFLTPLRKRFGERLKLINTQQNASVRFTLEILEKGESQKFNVIS